MMASRGKKHKWNAFLLSTTLRNTKQLSGEDASELASFPMHLKKQKESGYNHFLQKKKQKKKRGHTIEIFV